MRIDLHTHSTVSDGTATPTEVIKAAAEAGLNVVASGQDRMDITGARWGLDGAEAILKLRALTTNGDFDQYWTWHLAQKQQRIHNSRYLDEVIPQ